jgi:hypothetical protein
MPATEPITILVVDDERGIREVAAESWLPRAIPLTLQKTARKGWSRFAPSPMT